MNSQERNPVGRSGAAYERESVGIGRVILPPNTDRDIYIKNCYQCSTVSMISRVNLDVIHDVTVDTSVLERIVFPDTSEKLGSSVVWINLPIYNSPVIVALINNSDDMVDSLEENEFSFSRWDRDGQVSISGLARDGSIYITSQSNTNKGGRLKINVSNKNRTGILDVTVNGDFYLESKTAELKLQESFSVEVNSGIKEEKTTSLIVENDSIEGIVSESTSGFRVEESEFTIGKGNTRAVMGDEKEKFIHSLIDVIAGQTVATSLGPQPLVNAAGILKMKTETSKWLSSYLKIE